MRPRYLILGFTILLLGTAAAVVLAEPGGGNGHLPPAPDGSTLVSTWMDRNGNGVLGVGKGEQFRDLTDLAPVSAPKRTVATLAQIADAHLRDEESPARAPLVDRLSPRLNSTFRPQEALTPQVLAATLRSVNAVHPDAVLETGDLIDSDQVNELGQAVSVLRGGTVHPDSGAPGYDGLQELSNPDPFIYRPGIDAPRFPGLLDRAEQPFSSPGLEAPWYPALGNHDLLVQGEVPTTPLLDRIATGDRLLVRLDPDLRPPRDEAGLNPRVIAGYLGNGLPGTTEPIPPDAARRHMTPAQAVSGLRRASGAPGSGPNLNYSFDVGPRVRVIVLDLVRRGGGSGGRVDGSQLRWLRAQLRAAGDRWVVVISHQSIEGSAGGGGVLSQLDRDPRVVAVITGHTHQNSIEPRPTSAGGYWLISTAALTDFPQQARAIRIIETENGVELETWMLDSAPGGLADISRQLAYLDAGGGRPQDDAGTASDRNARLFLARP